MKGFVKNMKYAMYKINEIIKNGNIFRQIRKVWEEIREVEQACVNKDTENFFEECNDVMQAVYTLQLIYCKKNKIDPSEIELKNRVHIDKMRTRYEKI